MAIPRYGAANFDTLQCAVAGGRMTVKNRRLVYTHPLTGAQSHLLTIERMDGNQPMQLPDALCVRVMNDYRIGLVGFSDGMRDRLRSLACSPRWLPGRSGCSSWRQMTGRRRWRASSMSPAEVDRHAVRV
jgi:hypothetical protein